MMVLFIAALFSCTAKRNLPKAQIASHPENRGVMAIDELIVNMKDEFIYECYTPVIKREIPETRCQIDLFQLLERRYHTNYRKEHVDMASDDLFFRDVDQRIRLLVRQDPQVRKMVRANFRSQADLLQYYKSLYGFHPITSNN